MTSKVTVLRLPSELAQAIETQAEAAGIDQETLVVETLSLAFGLPIPSPVNRETEALRQKLDQIDKHVHVLSEQLALLEPKTDWDSNKQSLIALLKQSLDAFKLLNNSTTSQSSESELVDQTNETLTAMARTDDRAETTLLEQIISNFPELIYVQDRTGRCTYINSLGAQILGFQPNFFLGKTLSELGFSAENVEQLVSQYQLVFSTGQSIRDQLSVCHVHGCREYEYFLNPIIDANGNINAVFSITRDITERRQAEKALQESEEKYRSLFELANDSILIIDAETQGFLNVNWNAARRLGYTRSEVLNLAIEDISLPMSAQRQQALEQELRINGNVVFEHIYRCKDGVEIPVEISSQIIEYDNRLAIQSFVRDISKRKRTREAFQKQREIRQTIFEHIPILIFFFDADCQIQLINRETEEVLGWSLAELQKIDLWSQCYPHPEYRQMVIEHMQTADAGWQDFQTRVRDGRLLDISWTTVQLSDGTLIGIGRDVTQRKHSERELRQAHSELEERSEKLIELNHQLQSTLEELRTAEEELLVQNETIAKAHQQLEIEVRHYQDLFDLAPDAYLLTDSEGVIEEANQAAAELLSCEQEHLLGKALKEFIPSGERRAFLSKLSQMRKSPSGDSCQLTLKTRRGSTCQVGIKLNARQDSQGPVTGFRWLMRELVS
ncbi:PAS domain S-box protein [Lyngbya aestuarii]|uniref:PAS domain S-box protein n=1 Tax=Lyngbya aestuarii TaxID=118322 RepID=UPI00403DEACB